MRDVSAILAERGINVEELESEVASAPMSGVLIGRRTGWRTLRRARVSGVLTGRRGT